ncbi:heterodisulfide reductase-related iron-sulfur binding cluster [Geobacter sp. SVR]|uniref:heterodisulfide reductase-related iron-sulfur binding cluster n=1 Tax=Geobacter sp. SVR TaxID=2495594 RepID=UPI00143EF707|nr:heterodisulfide reductase-related iron-sulfur binding cluster [Geobacter sp. SVR]BCS52780.1 electron transporter [Geobacter sp. SVR]GCF86646.1 electron transporter [Geobacter sp. SVR]
MEATREIYWNVGHGVVLPMYLLAIAAFAVLAWGFWQRLPVWRQGKPLDRLGRYDERVKRLIADIFSQQRVFRVRDGGLPHALFFWSFLVLFVGTMLVMLQADFFTPLMQVNLLSGEFYKGFSLALDLAGILAILMLAGLFIRRFVIQPKGLEIVCDDYIVLQLLFAILVTGFLIEGARMAATEVRQNPALALYSPGGLLAARLFMTAGPDTLSVVHKLLWWLHFVLVLGLFCAIPYTKLRHIFTTSANGFLVPLEPKGFIPTINLEDEQAEQFGAATVKDLTWKDIFDADACTACKRCQDRCPASATDKPLSPMKVVQQIGEVAVNTPEANLCQAVSQDVLWACTTCRACQDICPANIEHVNKILEMRRNLTLMEGAFPGDEVRTAIGNLEVNANPFGLAYAGRGDWTQGLDVRVMAEDPEVDLLYFVGCYASFDKRNQEIARNFVRICNAAGIRVGILGKEEKCCGEPPRKLGNEYLYQMMATENIELIKGYGVKRVVTTCPHCFNTLAKDYRDLGLDIPVEHYATFIAGLLADNRLKLTAAPFDCTYHDSCYLGRYMDIIEQPRGIIRQAGGHITEMDNSGYDSFCCGAGGGRILAEEKIGSRINVARVNMAHDTGAPLLVSNCPFCLTMFEDGIKTGGVEGEIRVRDLAEILAERIRA